MMELFKFQNLLLIVILAELSMFVNGSSNKKGTLEWLGSAIKNSRLALPGLNKYTGGSSATTSSKTARNEPVEPEGYHECFDYKKRDLEHELKCLKENLDSKENVKLRKIEVDKRNGVLIETYRALRKLSVQELLNCEIRLKGDNSRYFFEQYWYTALMSDMLDDRRELFQSTKNKLGLLINPLYIEQNNNYEDQFRFVGKMLALGIHKGLTLFEVPVQLGRIFLKTILKRKIHLIDVEAADRGFYNRLINVQKYPTKHTFTLDGIPLKDNGDQIKVTTNEDVEDYMKFAIQYKYFDKVSKEIEAFLDGFNMLVPLKLLHNFKPSDLEILLYGQPPSINLDDWRKKIKVIREDDGSYDYLIEKFWKIMKDHFYKCDKIKLLYFITGTTRFEVDDCNKLKTGKLFEIYEDLGAYKTYKNRLPTTNISAKRLHLYNWTSYDMRDKLKTAIENSEPYN